MNKNFLFNEKFYRVSDKVGNIFWLNLLCLLCCIPIITTGASLTACYYVTMRMARNEEGSITHDFFRSFRQNFKQSTLIWMLLTLFSVLLFLGAQLLRTADSKGEQLIPFSDLLLVINSIVLILVTIESVYIFPLLAKFDNSIFNTFRNAFQISFRHPSKTLLILVINIISPVLLLVVLLHETAIWVLSFLMCFGISAPAFACSILFVKIFDQYID